MTAGLGGAVRMATPCFRYVHQCHDYAHALPGRGGVGRAREAREAGGAGGGGGALARMWSEMLRARGEGRT